MKLAVSLVFFMLVQHVLSAPTHPPPSGPLEPPDHYDPFNPHRAYPGPTLAPMTDSDPNPNPNNQLPKFHHVFQRAHVHGCSDSGCAHIRFTATHPGIIFHTQHLTSTHFTTESNQSKSLTISVLLSDDL